MFLLIISFTAGVLTVLAPCILPVLPIIVGGSLTGAVNLKKALIIVGSLAISVILFTFLLKVSTALINIPPTVWSIISGGIILIFGLITLFPKLWDGQLINRFNLQTNQWVGKGQDRNNFIGDVIIGAALGPVFSSCSPTYFLILATILPKSFVAGLGYILIYVLGLSLALLLIVIIGQKIMGRVSYLADPNGWFKRGLGLIFIVVGLLILSGYDKILEANLLTGGLFDITTVEQKLLINHEESTSTSTLPVASQATTTPEDGKPKPAFLTLADKAARYPRPPEIIKPAGFINTGGKPIKLSDYIGKKVILLDIWTYSCINCQRTLPYVVGWYNKYKDEDFVVIGIHTPEFAFEKVQANVEKAVKEKGITYPVVLDNDYATWQALGNQYWPRKYLIDIDGFIVYDHIGEGAYTETEKAIQAALLEKDARFKEKASFDQNTLNLKSEAIDKIASPETYFGAFRNKLGNGVSQKVGDQSFTLPDQLINNTAYLSGDWLIEGEYAESAGENSGVNFNYSAKNVYAVMSSDEGATVEVYIDNQLTNTLTVKDNKLYTLMEGQDYQSHQLKLRVKSGHLDLYTFTFG